MFTSLFVTRTIFTLLAKYNLIKNITMLHLIGVPKIDWYAKRKFFIPISLVVMLVGLVLLYERGMKDTLDVEFLGGVSAEVALKPEAAADYDDVHIRDLLAQVGEAISEDGERLADATVTSVPGDPTAFRVEVAGIPAPRLAAMISEPLESANLLQRGGGGAPTPPGGGPRGPGFPRPNPALGGGINTDRAGGPNP